MAVIKSVQTGTFNWASGSTATINLNQMVDSSKAFLICTQATTAYASNAGAFLFTYKLTDNQLVTF